MNTQTLTELKSALDRYFKVYADMLTFDQITADQYVLLH